MSKISKPRLRAETRQRINRFKEEGNFSSIDDIFNFLLSFYEENFRKSRRDKLPILLQNNGTFK